MAGLGHIDSHVAVKRPSESAPSLRSPQFNKRAAIKSAVAIVGAVLLIVAGAAVIKGLATDRENIVSDYFAYIKDGDVEEALLLMRTFPTGESGRFLNRDALGNDGWEVTRVEETVDGNAEQRFVNVTIEGPNGEVNSTVDLSYTDEDGWLIDNGLYSVVFENSPLRYAEVNNVVASRRDRQVYYLLPGVYNFYTSNESVRTRGTPRMVTFTGFTPDTAVTPTGLKVTKEGAHAVQQEVEVMLDDCATHTTSSPAGCPFGLDDDLVGQDEDVDALRDLSWEIVDYPATEVTTDEFGYLAIFAIEPGTVKVSGSDASTDKQFSTECEMDLQGSRVDFTFDGTVSVELGSAPCRHQG